MEVISSIYNSGHNIKKFYLGSRELNLAYLGNQVIYDEVIGDNDLNYILYEFYVSDTLPNTVEAPVKSAILKGSTKYRDIDTGEILETFEEGRNLELVSVRMPVLKTTNNKYTFSDFEIIPNSGDAVVNETYKDDRSVTLTATNRWARIRYNVKHDNGVSYNLKFDYNATNNFVIDFNGYMDGRTHIDSGTGSFSRDFIAKNNEIIHFAFPGGGTVEITNIEFSLAELKDEPYKTNILTVNEDVTLRSNGSVCDELDLLSGKLTQRIGENGEILTQEVVKTVDLTIVDQDGKTINKLNSFNGTTHVSTEVAENSAYPMVSLEVASELQAAMSKVAEDIELIKPVQNDIETTIDTQSNDIDSLLLATTELFEMFL